MSLPAPPLNVSTAPSSGCPAMPSQSVIVSSPVPPIRTSCPLRPSRASLPPSPRTTSSPFVPLRSSELLVPVISSRWAAYAEPVVPTRAARRPAGPPRWCEGCACPEPMAGSMATFIWTNVASGCALMPTKRRVPARADTSWWFRGSGLAALTPQPPSGRSVVEVRGAPATSLEPRAADVSSSARRPGRSRGCGRRCRSAWDERSSAPCPAPAPATGRASRGCGRSRTGP